MVILGITGIIAAGKTSATQYLLQNISNSKAFILDDALANLYKTNNNIISWVQQNAPSAICNKTVDKNILGKLVLSQPTLLKELEKITSLELQKQREEFISQCRNDNIAVAILDIPLLYEYEIDKICDYVIAIVTTPEIQQERYLARPNSSLTKLQQIISKQKNIAQFSQLANIVIYNDKDINSLHSKLNEIIVEVINKLH